MTDQFSEADSPEFETGGDRRDELFDVLSDSRRRFTLQYLQTAEAPLSVGELATELLSWESQRTASAGGDTERDAIEVSLVHTHLPKMAQAGLVSYDASRQMVTSGDHADEVRPHLRATTTS